MCPRSPSGQHVYGPNPTTWDGYPLRCEWCGATP